MQRLLIATSLVLTALLPSCANGPAMTEFPAAQSLVDSVAAAHDDVVRLTIHAVPAGGEKAQVIASTSAEKRGSWSDPEDIQAMDSGEAVELMEGDDLDLSVPVMDASGTAMAVVGVTVSGDDQAAMRQSAEQIAAELADGIRTAATPMW